MTGVACFAAGVFTVAGAWTYYEVHVHYRRRKATQAALARLKTTATVPSAATHTLPGTNVVVVPPGAGTCHGCHGEGWIDGDYSQVVCLNCHGTGDAS